MRRPSQGLNRRASITAERKGEGFSAFSCAGLVLFSSEERTGTKNRQWSVASSQWLIKRFIDPKAHFVFGDEPGAHSEAIPFDMFVATGFGHRGEDCSFETLCKEFSIREKGIKRVAQIIHDADLGDEKFGRAEGHGLDHVLKGWARQGLGDDELLRRGMELIEGLYHSLA